MMLRIRIHRELERRVLREVRGRLRKRREEWREQEVEGGEFLPPSRQPPEYRELWRRVLERRPAGMSRAEYLRFRLLDRQFEGKPTPLLPSAVRVARFVVRRFPRLKKRLEA